MCSELHLICVDLTDATINENITMGKRLSTPTALPAQRRQKGNLVPTGLDLTHTNSYGAKLNAWLIDQLTIDTPLGAYSKHKEKPTYKQFYGDAANPDYVPSSYVSPPRTARSGRPLPTPTAPSGMVPSSAMSAAMIKSPVAISPQQLTAKTSPSASPTTAVRSRPRWTA